MILANDCKSMSVTYWPLESQIVPELESNKAEGIKMFTVRPTNPRFIFMTDMKICLTLTEVIS